MDVIRAGQPFPELEKDDWLNPSIELLVSAKRFDTHVLFGFKIEIEASSNRPQGHLGPLSSPGLQVFLRIWGWHQLFAKKVDFGTPIFLTPQLSCVVIGGDFAPIGFLRCPDPLESTSNDVWRAAP